MTPRTFLSIILLALVFPAQEIWQLWKHSNREVNWWLSLDYPLSIQWYFKFFGLHLAEILKSTVIYRITYKIQALRMAAIVVLIYSLVDFVFFFINFNRAEYALIYATVGSVSMVVIYWRNISKSLKNILHPQKSFIASNR
jgi:hypothetical protein